MSTYKGKWAACSGSIESTDASPEEAAKREIQEETTLTDADIALFRRGKPFSLIDEGLNTEWTIHPFAWMMKEGAKDIKFDWEHTEYEFIKPKDLESYDTVPNLGFGLGRCLVGPETEKSLNALRDDHESGAQAMALLALEMLLKIARGSDLTHVSETKEYWKEFRMIAWHLAKNGRPSMGAAIEASLFKALSTTLDLVGKHLGKTTPTETGDIEGLNLDAFKEIAETAISQIITSRKSSLETLGEQFVAFVVDTQNKSKGGPSPSPISLVTLSRSGTITKCLLELVWRLVSTNRTIKLCILESRPKFEGAAFANGLLSELLRAHNEEGSHDLVLKNLKIEIVSDASMATVVEHADYVLFGADKVLSNGNTSNKIGSLATAVIAKTLNPECKVVAVFETEKITGSSAGVDHFKVEYNDEAEVTSAWPSSVATALQEIKKKGYQIEVKNAYFDWVPSKYIDEYITEQGRLGVDDIKKLSVESEKLEKKLFSDV